MYLKSIDLFGFKTFADRTRLEFLPGIAGIVGPNGSGKSNFVDAVRWVLGEQSARQLRGARMDDVIFAGNALRRPLGMAEVTLTFDNGDGALPTPFSEIAVTRRVYRTGESEFFLNRTQVRLRDITDLLLGTGLAAELAAIVSQGEIDAILSAKPEQRRELFEGVAGTSRYRVRKREAQRRLEQTAVNALRLNDLLIELEKQIPAIEQQVRRAKRYQKASQQVRDLEILSYLRKTSARREERSRIVSVLGSDENEATAIAARHTELQAALNKARYDEYQASLALDERNAAHAKAAAALQEHASAHAAAAATSAELTRQCEALEHEVDAAAQAETDADARLSTASEELRRSREGRDEALGLAETAASVEAAGTTRWERAYAELRSAEDKRARGAAAAAESNSVAAATDSAWQHTGETEKRLRGELTELSDKLSAERRRTAENAEAMRVQAVHAADLRRQSETLATELTSARSAFETAEVQGNRAQGALAHAEARLAALQELEAGDGGAAAGCQLLLAAQQAGKLSGVIGMLAQHVSVPSEHSLAIDALLGQHASDVILESSAAAQQAVQLLKSARAPRLTLIVLENLGASPRSAELREPGVIGTAVNLVRCGEQLKPVLDHLLAGAYVVDSLSTALSLARRHQQLVFATADGDVVRNDAITTGAARRPLALRTQIISLEEQQQAASALAVTSNAALEQAKRVVHELQERVAQLQEQSMAAVLREHDLRAAGDHSKHEIARLEQRARMLDSALLEVAAEAQALQQQAAEHRNRAEILQHEVEALEGERRSALATADELATELNELRARHRSAAANAAALVERVAQLTDDVEAARVALTRAQQQRKARLAALRSARGELETTAAQAGRLATLQAQAQAELAAVEQDMAGVRERRDACAAGTRELDDAYQQAQQRSREQSHDLERSRIRLAEIDAELSLLQETFAQNPASEQECAAIAERHADYAGDADADVRRLRDELVRLGNVNLNAVEDRSAALERCEFLRGQLRDLEMARTEILQSIAAMDAESLRQFNATFEKVAVAFSETFTRLFNGGSARIWIAESADPTEAGIEISAQPPGKKMQNLNLLSGGERALTAVALIFATLQVRPSPFYIFDEIDAALDEANIGRFGGLLAELAGRSQIIIITHNKATMTLVDRMYGITMGEPGVSSILSLALEQAGAAG